MADLDDQLFYEGNDILSEKNDQQEVFDLIKNDLFDDVDSQTSAASTLDVIRARIRLIEEKLGLELKSKVGHDVTLPEEEKAEVDSRSVFVKNIDYATTEKLVADTTYTLSEEEKADNRSVFVRNIDYATKSEVLGAHFNTTYTLSEAEKAEVDNSSVFTKNIDDATISEDLDARFNTAYTLSDEEKAEVDNRSVFVKNIDCATTSENLDAYFNFFGPINRITILHNKFNCLKVFAYIEFANVDDANVALTMNNFSLEGRKIKVYPKRTNKPGLSTKNRPVMFRGRALYRGRPMSRGGYRPRGVNSRRITIAK